MITRSLVNAGAIFSDCLNYRYLLWRQWEWREPVRRCLFILLNPSTADELVLDPTVRRCVGYATLWGYDALEVCNIFAWRSTDPAKLYELDDPVGPENDRVILERATSAAQVVVGWGNHGALHQRGAAVLTTLTGAGIQSWCFRKTKQHQPEHPLYQKASAELVCA